MEIVYCVYLGNTSIHQAMSVKGLVTNNLHSDEWKLFVKGTWRIETHQVMKMKK